MLIDQWHVLLDGVGHTAPLARGYLLDAKPVAVNKEQVTIGFDPEFAREKEIDYSHNRKSLQKVMDDLLGRHVNIVFSVLDAKDTLPGDIKMVPSAKKTTESAKNPVLAGKSNVSSKVKQHWAQNPAVRKVLELFNGDIIDVRE